MSEVGNVAEVTRASGQIALPTPSKAAGSQDPLMKLLPPQTSARIFKLPPGFVLVQSAGGNLVAKRLLGTPKATAENNIHAATALSRVAPRSVLKSSCPLPESANTDSSASAVPHPGSKVIGLKTMCPSLSSEALKLTTTTTESQPKSRILTVKKSLTPSGGSPVKSSVVSIPAVSVSRLHGILARGSSGGASMEELLTPSGSKPRIITLQSVLSQLNSEPQIIKHKKKPEVVSSKIKSAASVNEKAQTAENVPQTDELPSQEAKTKPESWSREPRPLWKNKEPVVMYSGASPVDVSSEVEGGASGKEGAQTVEKLPETDKSFTEETKTEAKTWCREPRPLWKSKEPVVMYSGASSENLKPRKKKELPPESLPCPKKLDDILPKAYTYHISSFEELKNPDNFKAEVRTNIFKKEDALQWLRDFEDISGTNFRIAKTFRENSSRLIFKKVFKCHKNTHRKDQVMKRESNRHVGCQARLSITVKNLTMRSSTDMLLPVFPCVLGIYHNHCHSLTTPDSLRYRRPLPEVKNAFIDMFKSKITPATARRLHMASLKRTYGDKYSTVVQDGARCPPLPWCYRLYYETLGKKVKDGKKKSTRKTYKKKVTPPQNACGQEFQESAPAMIEFNSGNGNVQTSHSLENIIDRQACDEVQRSINSLYDYELMSNNNRVQEQVVETVVIENNDNDSLVETVLLENTDDNNPLEEGVLMENNNDNELSDTAAAEEDFESGAFLGNEENVSVYEDNVENVENLVHSEAQSNEGCLVVGDGQSLNNYHENFSITEKDDVCRELQQTFEDIQSQLEKQPELYLPVVKRFITACKEAQQIESDLGVISALDELSADLPRVMTVRTPSLKREVSNMMQGVASLSPKRKVLVLRMNPNKFNQIIGKVEANVSAKEMINI